MNDIYGTDINKDWNFENGDLEIIKGSSNLGQAIVNRLRADTDTYDMFYNLYGGVLFEHMGDLNHPTIHEYIRIEIESILKQEPRIKDLTVTVDKLNTNTVGVDLKVTMIQTNEVVNYNLVLGDDSSIVINENNEFNNIIEV